MSQDYGIDRNPGPDHGISTSQGLHMGKGPDPDHGVGQSRPRPCQMESPPFWNFGIQGFISAKGP